MLANYLGIEGRPFVGDVTRSNQIWNQPFHSYTSTVEKTQAPSPGAASEAVKELIISTKLTYTVEVTPHIAPTHADRVADYRYRLELNANNEVIGGSWLSYDRPDFIWTNPPSPFSGYFAQLAEIYAASTK